MGFNPAAVDVPCRILLSSWQAELVVGERDEGVKRIRADSGANVQILDKSLPAAFRNRDECLAVVRADTSEPLRLAISGTLRRAFNVPRSGAVVDDKQRTVEVMIPEVACRHLVGARGDRIKLLREEAGCDVQLAPGPVGGLAAQRRVRCGGHLTGVEEAVARIHEVLVEFMAIGIMHPRHFDLQEVSTGPNTSLGFNGSRDVSAKNSRLAVRLLVSKDECGWLIGKRGNKIHKLRELALVSTRDADVAIMKEGSESVVEVFGAPLPKLLCVLQLIVDDLALMRDATMTTTLVAPAELGHAVDSRLDEVRTESGLMTARLRRCGQDWCVIELEGSERERLAAAGAVHELLEAGAQEQQAGSIAGAVSLVGVSGSGGNRLPAAPLVPLAQGCAVATSPPRTLSPVLSPIVASPSTVSLPAASKPATSSTIALTNSVAMPPASPQEIFATNAAESPARPLHRHQPTAMSASGPLTTAASVATASAVQASPPNALSKNGLLALNIQLPDRESVLRLADEDSGIARRAGVVLAAECVPGRPPLLVVEGEPTANAVACYLIQRALWLDCIYRST